MEKRKYFEELNIFRALIIIWVIIGHSFDEGANLLGFLHGYAYTFHMNAFFLLSGFFISSKLKRINSAKDCLISIADRAKRLLVPYFFFTAVSYVLKIFFERYANNELSNNIFIDTLLCRNNPNGGLWFLYTLFFISILFIILHRVNNYVMLAVSIAIKIIVGFVSVDFPLVKYAIPYLAYFAIGVILKDNYEKMAERITKAFKEKYTLFSAIMLIAFVISAIAAYIKLYIYSNVILNELLCIFNIILWYLISIMISLKPFKQPLMIVGDYGMDIYMIGYYVQIAIRVVLGSMLGLPYVVYSILMCILGIIAPIPISKFIIRKIPIARAIMLGDFKKKVKNNG